MILVIGDVMLDTYVLGNVERISPEAPVPVLLQKKIFDHLGGAANVAKIINKNCKDVVLMGSIFDDAVGNKIIRLCDDEQLTRKFCVGDNKEGKTPHKTRILANNQQICRIDNETQLPEFLDYRLPLQDDCVCVISDYAKGTIRTPSKIIDHFYSNNIRVIVDPKASDIRMYDGAFILKPNFKEFCSFLDTAGIFLEDHSISALSVAANKLISGTKIKNLVVTLAERGCLLISSDGDVDYFEAEKVDIADVTGAGDAFTAFLAMAINNNISIKSAVTLSLRAGTVAVKKIGTAPILLNELFLGNSLDKDTDIAENFADCDAKKQKKKIVFTNGCFDVLHVGHINLLEKAKKLGDKLIVGVNSDLSVKKLKGKDRPINNLSSRMKMLQSLECVDHVLPFDEDTPLNLIELLRPDVLVKGSDYSVDEIVGSKEVQAWGGQVLTVDLVDGYSTSALLTRMRD